MKTPLSTLLAAVFGLSASTGRIAFPSLGRSEPSEVQKRMHADWVADAPRRMKAEADNQAWNAKVQRRNQRFAARQRALGKAA